jgi:hypothetical protein
MPDVAAAPVPTSTMTGNRTSRRYDPRFDALSEQLDGLSLEIRDVKPANARRLGEGAARLFTKVEEGSAPGRLLPNVRRPSSRFLPRALRAAWLVDRGQRQLVTLPRLHGDDRAAVLPNAIEQRTV